jgi:uncharacterized protein YggT (Ycf19 family)
MASLVIMGIDFSKINWYYVAYVIASIMFTLVSVYALYSAETLARAAIYAIGLVLVLIFFGMRWFGSPDNTPPVWPPIINMCPDYLTYVQSIGGCVDFLGVSTADGAFLKVKPSDISSLSTSNTNKVFKFTSADVAAAKNSAELRSICDTCRAAGLTWEGVYDGDVCVGADRLIVKAKVADQCKQGA